MKQRQLGNTKIAACFLGLGGNRILRTAQNENEVQKVITVALAAGINYFDTARLYPHSEKYLGKGLKGHRKNVFIASKSHARDGVTARQHLEESLRELQTDYLDIWQIHDVRTQEDLDQILAPSGCLETFIKAKADGLVRAIGITAAQNPEGLARALQQFCFDVVLIPVNPAEKFYTSFLNTILPLAIKQNTGIVGMYLYWGGKIKLLGDGVSVAPYLQYALSQQIDIALVGCDSAEQLQENVAIAEKFMPMLHSDQLDLENLTGPYAKDLLYYRGLT